MKNGQLLFGALVATLIGVAAGVYLKFGQAPAATAQPPSLPAAASAGLFASSLPDSAGKLQAIAQWRGQLLVVNFWASWCAPCREEMPAFSRLQTKYAASGVQFVGIAIDNERNVADFARKLPVSYPLLVAGAQAGELTRQLGNTSLALPYTAIVDRSGQVRYTRLGRLGEAELDAVLAERIVDN